MTSINPHPILSQLKEKQLKQRVEASLDIKKFCEKIDKSQPPMAPASSS
ncbi:MAG: hypothetical protein ACI4NJ_11305 [Cellvibrio sp.]